MEKALPRSFRKNLVLFSTLSIELRFLKIKRWLVEAKRKKLLAKMSQHEEGFQLLGNAISKIQSEQRLTPEENKLVKKILGWKARRYQKYLH